MATRSEWVSRGRDAILELLNHQLAAPAAELEARICDRPWGDQPQTIDPHLLGEARRELEEAGWIQRVETVTRGGSSVALIQPRTIPHGKGRATEDAAARKRLLFARFKSWSRGTAHMPNFIGAGGEVVVHQSLSTAAPYGYRLIQPTRGEVASLFGEPIPGGPLDNAAWLTPLDQQTQAPVGRTYLVPIEVKNVRHWLYPNHWEIYQLLHKAAGLVTAHPEYPVVPILICRKAHYRTLQLARDIGFLVFQTTNQHVQPSERIEPVHFEEVRHELGFEDLMLTDAASSALISWFTGTVPQEAERKSERWKIVGPELIDHFAELRERSVRWPARVHHLTQMHAAVSNAFGDDIGSWADSKHAHPD